MSDRQQGGPPTLPPPPLWRLLVAGAAVLGFLYFIYQYVAEREATTHGDNSSTIVTADRSLDR